MESVAARDKHFSQQYADAKLVADRWAVYELTEEGPDHFESQIAGSINYESVQRVVDIGSSNGNFINLVAGMGGPDVQTFGVEPNMGQYNQTRDESISSELAKTISQHIGRLSMQDTFSKHAIMITGEAQKLPLQENSVDIVTSLYMLYHLSNDQQNNAIKEVIRVMHSHGVFLLTTSGDDNKHGHRFIEEQIAEELKIAPPAHMNKGFTSEKAGVMLADYFDDVYRIDTRSAIDISSDDAKSIYVDSQLSLANQYGTPQDRNNHEFIHTVTKHVTQALADRDFYDTAHRTLFICSNSDLKSSQLFTLPSSAVLN